MQIGCKSIVPFNTFLFGNNVGHGFRSIVKGVSQKPKKPMLDHMCITLSGYL